MGERLAAARRAADLSQRDLAKAVGVSNATIAMYEKGLRTPPGPILVAMARELRVPAESLIDVRDSLPASGE